MTQADACEVTTTAAATTNTTTTTTSFCLTRLFFR